MKERLTVYTEKGPALALDGPYRNEEEAKASLMHQYRQAVTKLAEYEDIDPVPSRLFGYKLHSELVSSMGNCNNCDRTRSCDFVPDVGEPTRINCPHWKRRRPDERPS